MSDLWNTSKEDRAQAAVNEAKRLNVEVVRVYPLTTGLWFSWVDTTGHSHTVCDYQLRPLLRSQQS